MQVLLACLIFCEKKRRPNLSSSYSSGSPYVAQTSKRCVQVVSDLYLDKAKSLKAENFLVILGYVQKCRFSSLPNPTQTNQCRYTCGVCTHARSYLADSRSLGIGSSNGKSIFQLFLRKLVKSSHRHERVQN